MSYTFIESVTLYSLTCSECGVTFAIPKHFEQTRRNDHKGFYCPNGHSQHFPHESEAERLRRDLTATQARVNSVREQYLAAERGKEKAEKSLKNLKKRTAAGVCPCCSRTVGQLARHMETQHKEYRALNGLETRKALTDGKANIQ